MHFNDVYGVVPRIGLVVPFCAIPVGRVVLFFVCFGLVFVFVQQNNINLNTFDIHIFKDISPSFTGLFITYQTNNQPQWAT